MTPKPMTNDADLGFLSIADASRKLAAKELSPVELTDALLRRIEAINPQLDAFLLVDGDKARAAAKTAEDAIQRGRRLGPLHGVPFGLKDIVDTAGMRTTCHSKLLEDNVPKRDAAVAAKLKAAGGVLIGKTATHEFALGGPAFDLPWPPARNPWNRDHHPGGSSSGSGAALAAGLLPMAIGTDTGGSVRNPASCCGIVGMKATYGRVSRAGVFPLSYSLDHIGPMTRTVTDNALMLQAIAGQDARDPASAPAAVPDFTVGIERGVKGLKVGYLRHFHEIDQPATPDMAAGLDAAVDVLKSEGAAITDVTFAPLRELAACNRIILTSEAYAIHRRWLADRPGDYSKSTRDRIMPGAFLSAAAYLDALRQRARYREMFKRMLASVDVIVCASSMDPACRIDDQAEVDRTYGRQARAPFNLLGVPALALPTGLSSGGMPLSMQIVGRAFDEATVYRVGRAYERAGPWADGRRPPVA